MTLSFFYILDQAPWDSLKKSAQRAGKKEREERRVPSLLPPPTFTLCILKRLVYFTPPLFLLLLIFWLGHPTTHGLERIVFVAAHAHDIFRGSNIVIGIVYIVSLCKGKNRRGLVYSIS